MGPGGGLKQPQCHEARICMWKYLDVHSMHLIDKAQTTDELKRVLAELFELQGWESDPRAAILLDLYFYTVQFSREHNFTREQSSTFFAIVKDTHEACVETPLSNVEECYHYFTELLFCHAVRRPPFSIDLFSQEQLALMSDYVVNTYFRHFKLYKYAFTPQVRLDISLSYVGMPEPELEPAAELGELAESVMVPVPPAQEEEADSGTTAPRESPRALLQEYISAQLCQELAQLRLEVEEQLRASEEQFNTKLALLEKVSSSPKGGGRGHRK
ncbi:cilia- and flagella-associated protein 119 isoform X2 [Chelonoidis abingdonii]|uniref:cilia- and flagella-associated protein 119 isoform X2 n=1 Tax=Chelonoidis abingdonii TaxID=106734 RepID=UPI0013F1C7E9|nr:coiled-coil domain-containing protein 189 isoform X2 [Chelonoidis abingdonii]